MSLSGNMHFFSGFPHSVDQKFPMVPWCPSHGRSKHVEITDSSREQLERVLLKQASPMRTPTADQVPMGSSRLRASVVLQPIQDGPLLDINGIKESLYQWPYKRGCGSLFTTKSFKPASFEGFTPVF